MEEINYYTGFEGEGEICFHVRSNDKENIVLSMWVGDFDDIITQIPTGDDGNWKGLCLPYHLHTGWYEESEWLVENKQELCEQLKGIRADALDLRLIV